MVTHLAIVADIHHGRDTLTKRGSAALALLERFIDCSNDGDIDAVIELGDRISDEAPERDRALQRDVAELFFRLTVPRHHVSGNHDMALLTAADNASILEVPLDSRVLRVGDARIVFWQPDVSLTLDRGLHLAAGDLERLRFLLGDDDAPTLLVTHVPLSGQAQLGNYYFERNPGHATYAEVDAIRGVIAAAPCPIVALAGHVHWNTLTIVDGTPHLTLQSLTETFTTGEPAASVGLLEIDGEELRWRVSGADGLSLVLPWPRRKRRWAAPLGKFQLEEMLRRAS
jgi:hypothetical protein